MHGLSLASRSLRGGFTITRFRAIFGYIGARVYSSSDVDGERCQEVMFDAILMTDSRIGTKASLKQDAKSSLIAALNPENLHVWNVKESTFVGNVRGLDLVELCRDLKRELASQNEKIAELGRTIVKQGLPNSSLEKRIRSLSHSDSRYKFMRQRYLSAFKKNSLRCTTSNDEGIITEGNETVHGGDAVVDAALYVGCGGKRTDIEVFKKLYGLLPADVARIKHGKTIYILNTHARIIGSNRETRREEFFGLFTKFVDAFKRSEFDESYLKGKKTKVTHAYWEFVNWDNMEAEASRKRRRH